MLLTSTYFMNLVPFLYLFGGFALWQNKTYLNKHNNSNNNNNNNNKIKNKKINKTIK